MTDAGLCIDCGKRPQPARRDGEPGTHHRCNPCARVWLARRARRRALLDGEWGYTGGPFGRVCETCNRTVPEGEWVFRIGPDPDGGPVLCWDCAVDAGYARALASAAPAPAYPAIGEPDPVHSRARGCGSLHGDPGSARDARGCGGGAALPAALR